MLKEIDSISANGRQNITPESSSVQNNMFQKDAQNSSANSSYKKLLKISILIVIIFTLTATILYIKSLNTLHENQLYKYQIGIMMSKQQQSNSKYKLKEQINKCQTKLIQIQQKNKKQLDQHRKVNELKYEDQCNKHKQKFFNQNTQFVDQVKKINFKNKENLFKRNDSTLQTVYDRLPNCSKQISVFQTDSSNTQFFFSLQFPTVIPPRPFVAQKQMYLPKKQQLSKLKSQKDLILVTHAGRRQYLQVLYLHLLKQHHLFYQWHLWMCTQIKQDIQFMNQLVKLNKWIKIIIIDDVNKWGSMKFNHFYRRDLQKNKVYMKLDDDTLYIDENFIQTMWSHRFKLQERMVIYPNIINNAMVTHIHQRAGVFQYPQPVIYNCIGNGWYNPNISLTLHKDFIESAQKQNISKWKTFKQWEINGYERFSINGFLYYSQTIDSLFFWDQHSDEVVFAMFYPQFYKSPALIVGDAIMVHGAFFIQRNYFKFVFPQMVEKYRQIALKK